jgi:hypothetical protein
MRFWRRESAATPTIVVQGSVSPPILTHWPIAIWPADSCQCLVDYDNAVLRSRVLGGEGASAHDAHSERREVVGLHTIHVRSVEGGQRIATGDVHARSVRVIRRGGHRDGHSFDTGNRANALRHSQIQIVHLGNGRAEVLELHGREERVVEIHSEIERRDAAKASHEEAGANEQQHRERRL